MTFSAQNKQWPANVNTPPRATLPPRRSRASDAQRRLAFSPSNAGPRLQAPAPPRPQNPIRFLQRHPACISLSPLFPSHPSNPSCSSSCPTCSSASCSCTARPESLKDKTPNPTHHPSSKGKKTESSILLFPSHLTRPRSFVSPEASERSSRSSCSTESEKTSLSSVACPAKGRQSGL